jgi:hypothetical protein
MRGSESVGETPRDETRYRLMSVWYHSAQGVVESAFVEAARATFRFSLELPSFH